MWQYFMPTKVIFSKNVLEKNIDLFKNFGSKALIITGKHSSRKNGSLQDLEKSLQSAGVYYEIYDKIEENPTYSLIREAVYSLRDRNFDFIIGLGGGSPLDSAKAIAVLLKNKDMNVEDLYNASKYEQSLPICAIPTTSGTGSEVTQYSVLTDDSGYKKGFAHLSIFPALALIDPIYTISMNASLTRSTGLDALCHAVEGFVSKRATPVSDLYAVRAMELIKENLPKALENPEDLGARENMACASCLAGMVISQTSTTLAHVLGYPLSTFKGIRHGDATALFLDSIVNQAEKEIPEKIATIKKIFTDIGEFIASVGLKVSVQITDEELESWVNRAKQAAHNQWTRGIFDEKLLRHLYERVKKD